MNVKVSSITYVKNGFQYIEKCIRSVMKQSLKEIEIIVVDGGSNDGTLEILNKLAYEDERIILLSALGSVGKQFNNALSIASGEYVAICEGDDYILPDKYKELYELAKENQLDVIKGCYDKFIECDGKEIRYKCDITSKDLYDKVIINKDNFLLNKIGINAFWSALYKREFLVSNNIYMNETKGAAYQDVTFSFLIGVYAKRIMILEKSYHRYRLDNENASTYSLDCVDLLINEYNILKKQMMKHGVWEQYKGVYFEWEIRSLISGLLMAPSDIIKTETEKIYQIISTQKTEINCSLAIYEDIISKIDDGEEQFKKEINKYYRYKNAIINYFEKEAFQEEKFIIFGMGYLGNVLYDFLSLAKKEILIVDNSELVQKKGFRGRKVYAPGDFLNKFDGKIIIANAMHTKDIYEKLMSYNVEKTRILILDNDTLFIRKIFVGMKNEYIEV